MEFLYKEQELPYDELHRLGLMINGRLSIDPQNKSALLSGRRTGLISMQNLVKGNFHIEELHAKLSLIRDSEEDRLLLNIHPVFKEIQQHVLLTQAESERLERGIIDHISKSFPQTASGQKNMNIEYDMETREFVSYDPDQIIVADMVEEERLTMAQKKGFTLGEIIELKNGIKLQLKATERKGLLANVASLTIGFADNGRVERLVISGINDIPRSKQAMDYGR